MRAFSLPARIRSLLSKFEKTAVHSNQEVTFSTVWLKGLFRVWIHPVHYVFISLCS